MRAATVSVGLVSPRSTCESIGALTPLRSARSRSESPEDSRSAFTRAPMTPGSSGSLRDASASVPAGCLAVGTALDRWGVAIRAYVITDTTRGERGPGGRRRGRPRAERSAEVGASSIRLDLARRLRLLGSVGGVEEHFDRIDVERAREAGSPARGRTVRAAGS